jgi:hypothetical protein
MRRALVLAAVCALALPGQALARLLGEPAPAGRRRLAVAVAAHPLAGGRVEEVVQLVDGFGVAGVAGEESFEVALAHGCSLEDRTPAACAGRQRPGRCTGGWELVPTLTAGLAMAHLLRSRLLGLLGSTVPATAPQGQPISRAAARVESTARGQQRARERRPCGTGNWVHPACGSRS